MGVETEKTIVTPEPYGKEYRLRRVKHGDSVRAKAEATMPREDIRGGYKFNPMIYDDWMAYYSVVEPKMKREEWEDLDPAEGEYITAHARILNAVTEADRKRFLGLLDLAYPSQQ